MRKVIKIWLVSLNLLVAFQLSAQNFDEYQLKVRFIDNFCQYVVWQDPLHFKNKTTFNLVILGENPFDNFINLYFRDKKISNKNVIISYISNIELLPENCDALFIASSEKYRIKKVLEKTAGRNILTIGDSEAFGNLGVHINMFLENNRIRFELNEKALDESQLKANFRLIQVAKVINPIRH